MNEPIEPKGRLYEGQSPTYVARILRPTGAAIVQSDVSSVTCKVFDLSSSSPDTATTTLTLTVNDVFFNTMQTDGYWALDNTGYNFRHTLAGSNLSKGGRRYRAEYTIVTTSYGSLFAAFEVTTAPLRGG